MVTASKADRAMKGIWETITLTNGSQVRAELQGDEHFHFWQSESGEKYLLSEGKCKLATGEEINKRATAAYTSYLQAEAKIRKKSPLMKAQSHMTGHKKGLIILVEFSDLSFSMENPSEFFTRMANEEGFVSGSQKGSIRDYFINQSNGKFVLDFDVAGPYKLLQPYSFYGKDGENGNIDVNVKQMITQAVGMAGNEVNYKDYDWDGDDEVEQVYIIYAGGGQATGGGADTVWPHKSSISGGSLSDRTMVMDGVIIDNYACSNEMYGKKPAGIGTICHEFSHCLGYPDMYDVRGNEGETNTWYGMGSWDLMNSGSHNSNGYCPAGYTGWEKWQAGWIAPIVLNEDKIVEGMTPQSEHGESYIIYNAGNPNEYYMLDNRQKTSWDRALAGTGLLIMHVDYDPRRFVVHGRPNTPVDDNDHQHITIIHADNKTGDNDEEGDPYPYGNNNSLSNITTPAATVYNRNTDGSNFMNIKISEITQNEDGTISFVFGDKAKADKSILLSETFDNCKGTGGNDGTWLTMRTAVGEFKPDNEGWEAAYIKGGYLCARVGDKASNAKLQFPALEFKDKTVLSFCAAPFAQEGTMTLNVSTDDTGLKIATPSFALTPQEFIICETEIEGSGTAHIILQADCRFYLDNVVVKSDDTDAIDSLKSDGRYSIANGPFYDLSGRKVNSQLKKGVYIINGKKVLK
ncbi:MAG: M6 family metalloprotease domain-containing protein [Bacteroidaceae bacterium]|nr:M6 family metalloprotease domain-containing protein [Bacteroidaceae bacterium]